MGKARIYSRIAAFGLAAALAVTGLGACDQLGKIADVADRTLRDLPSKADTYTSMIDITRAMEEALSRGETELSFNIANVDLADLENIGANMSSFWGKPLDYSIAGEYKGLTDIVEGRAVDVMSIASTLSLSDNFYVYNSERNKIPIPDDRQQAKEIAAALPGIAMEIFSEGMSDYEKALAAHDWLVANIEYDISSTFTDETNSSYGAIILKRTLCQGYADAFELLLRCYTDTGVVQVVGEALNPQNGETHAWGGHVWNAVKMDGAWYHIDVTFDDPIGNAAGKVSHYYFGQTDDLMSKNHKWARDFFPSANAGDFLYFRKSNLFFEGWDVFEMAVSGMLTEEPIESLEAAIQDPELEEINLQFMYDTRREIDELWCEEKVWNDVHVLFIDLLYPTS